MRRHLLRLLLTITVALACTGCPSFWNTELTKSSDPDELYKMAEEDFNNKKYGQAIEIYDKLNSAHPDFKEIPEVNLRIADAYFEQGSFEKAIDRYRKYAEHYPGHKGVPRAKFQEALANFNQIKKTDLDSAMVQKAARSFKTLMDDPEAGEYAAKAEEKYKECLKKLAEKEIYKAQTYINMGNYPAAKIAAKRVLEEYPKMGFDEEANRLIDKLKNK